MSHLPDLHLVRLSGEVQVVRRGPLKYQSLFDVLSVDLIEETLSSLVFGADSYLYLMDLDSGSFVSGGREDGSIGEISRASAVIAEVSGCRLLLNVCRVAIRDLGMRACPYFYVTARLSNPSVDSSVSYHFQEPCRDCGAVGCWECDFKGVV